MNKLRRISSRKDTLQFCNEHSSLIAIGTLILGYLSFYSYAARYSLSYLSPSITFIAGLGIVCLLIFGLLYFVARFKAIYRGIRVLILLYTLSLINTNPIILFAILYGLIDNSYHGAFSTRLNFKKIKQRYLKFPSNNKKATWIILILFLIIGIFYSLKLFVAYIFIDSCLRQFEIAIFYKPKTLNFLLIVILLPIFIFGYFIENSNYMIFGIAQQQISITKKDSKVFQATLVFKDDNNLYLKDSSYVPVYNAINALSNNCIVLKLDEIKSYKTLPPKIESSKDRGFWKLFKQTMR